jgi:hypothetical protein
VRLSARVVAVGVRAAMRSPWVLERVSQPPAQELTAKVEPSGVWV